ncbi:hypothetical protein NIES2109_34050 [Nostoc sp. HK-01]|nr:hypothetical protein NIES2109_34050 [Nostoc sp. HK-01]
MNHELFKKIEELYVRAVLADWHPHDLAKALEEMANMAWDEVDELYPQSMLP